MFCILDVRILLALRLKPDDERIKRKILKMDRKMKEERDENGKDGETEDKEMVDVDDDESNKENVRVNLDPKASFETPVPRRSRSRARAKRTLPVSSGDETGGEEPPKKRRRLSEEVAMKWFNEWNEDKLRGLFGVGAKIAKQIIASRPYKDVDDVAGKSSISAKIIKKIVDRNGG